MSTPLPAQAYLSEVTMALRNLRRPWPKGWPGLPLVFQRAWQQLALGSPRKGSRVHALQAFGLAVCEQIERDGTQRYAPGA